MFSLVSTSLLLVSTFLNRCFSYTVFLLIWLVVGCRCKANCLLVGPGPIGGSAVRGVFLKDPRRYLREFQKNHDKF